MKEKLSVAVTEDAEQVKKWSCLSESEMDQSWTKLAERMEEDVLDKYNVEESNKEVFNGRSASLGWRRVRKNNRNIIKSGERIVGREFSPCLENTTCSVCKGSRRRERKKKR